MAETRAPHVALLSSPGMGHLFPVVELAKRLVLDHGFTATIITYTDFNAASHLNSFSLPPSISSLFLPSVPLHDLPPRSRIETLFSVLSARSAPSVVNLLLSLKCSANLVAFVTDFFCVDTLPISKHLGIPRYILFTSNYFMLAFMFHLPTLHETTSCEFRDLPDPLALPGCVPLSGEDFFDPLSDRTDDAYSWIVHMARLFAEADGMLVNSFVAFEPETARAIPTAYPVGPIVRCGSGDSVSECVKWLDEQPRGSVLFVSFGSWGTLTCRQTEELAMGLELSGQKFLWVVRTPSDSEANVASENPKDYLPEGFLSRTESAGFVMANWAPQIEVLEDGAFGGFLSHCGWNSTLESVLSGVPMIAWPLYAEQRMNTVMLTEGAKIALRAKSGGNGVVGREEICRLVKELMEGEEGREAKERVLRLQKAGKEALGKEGNSCSVLATVVKKWKESCVCVA